MSTAGAVAVEVPDGLAVALRLAESGVSIIPIKTDGSKAPSIATWKPYQQQQAPKAEIVRWFTSGPQPGLAMISGAVSGNVEVIDFDDLAAYAEWLANIRVEDPELLDRLVIVETPDGGHHVRYRCPEVTIPGNKPLARRPPTQEEIDAAMAAGKQAQTYATLIETRGEGGYAIIPPSPAACHPSGRSYQPIQGDLANLPVISARQRDLLLETCRLLNRYAEPTPPPRSSSRTSAASSDDLLPGTDFDQRGDPRPYLVEAGWKLVRTRGDGVEEWLRPGGESRLSATIGAVGKNNLYAFSTNADPFEVEKSYTPFGIYARLKHGGDFSAARQALREMGFGSPIPETVPLKRPGSGSASDPGRAFEAEAAEAASAAGDEWTDPIPLDAVDLPAFPINVLEPWMGEMVEATAEALQVPVDLPGMLALTVLATAFQRRVEAVVRPGWHEPLSLFTLVTAAPGERKSATYSQMMRPISDYEGEAARLMASEIAGAKAEHDILAEALDRLKKQAGKAAAGPERARLIEEAKAAAIDLENLRVPTAPRLTVDDTTTEKMGILLAEQGGRMALLSPEGDAFDMLAGRYQNGAANIGIYLRGHAGDDILVDRVGRPSLFVPRAAVSMGLTIQPDVLLGMTTNATFRGRGLLARFFYGMPKSTIGEREVRPDAIPAKVAQLYAARVKACLETPSDNRDGKPVPYLMEFGPDADDAIAAFEEWIEPKLRPGGELGTMDGWASKLAGATARVAALLHASSLAGAPDFWRIPVDADAVLRAHRLAKYLIPHAQAAFASMGCDPSVKGARDLLGWLQRRAVPNFSQDEAFNGLRNYFPRSGDLDKPLILLMEHGYVRPVEAPKKAGPGRPSSRRFDCHPSIYVG